MHEGKIMNKHTTSVHGGKKPFRCDICDYSLAQKSIMKERNDLKVQLVNPIFIGKAPFH